MLSVVGENKEEAKKNGAEVKGMLGLGTQSDWSKKRQMWTQSKTMDGTDYFALTNDHSKTLLHANSKGILSIGNTIPVAIEPNRTKNLVVPDKMKENKGISIITNMQFISLKYVVCLKIFVTSKSPFYDHF